jgi:hypothetical protein
VRAVPAAERRRRARLDLPGAALRMTPLDSGVLFFGVLGGAPTVAAFDRGSGTTLDVMTATSLVAAGLVQLSPKRER